MPKYFVLAIPFFSIAAVSDSFVDVVVNVASAAAVPEPFACSTASLLAVDTSTERLSLALCHRGQLWRHESAGGAQASNTLIPAIFALLADAGVALDALDALVFGRGPGSFSGLRTAASVVQGLALGARRGAGLPVLPLGTLMAVAEEARGLAFSEASPALASAPVLAAWPLTIAAVLDARRGEVYQQTFVFDKGVDATVSCRALDVCTLVRFADWQLPAGCALVAGNALALVAAQMPNGTRQIAAWPTAAALLRLAPAFIAASGCVDAAAALPVYVRDKVAQTTDERMAAKKAQAALTEG